jgi:O-antigen ligase
MAMITAIVGLLLLFRARKEATSSNNFTVRLRPAVLALTAVGVIVALTSVYDQLALDGQLGSAAQQKAFYQADGAFGSAFSSRNEFFLALTSILDSPVLGGGSYSVATQDVAQSVADLYGLYGYQHVAEAVVQKSPAYHSELLGLWAENGILTLPFWLGVLIVNMKGLVAVLYRTCDAPALVAMIATIGIWDLFFSPFGADRRMWLALSIMTLIALTKRKGSGECPKYQSVP